VAGRFELHPKRRWMTRVKGVLVGASTFGVLLAVSRWQAGGPADRGVDPLRYVLFGGVSASIAMLAASTANRLEKQRIFIENQSARITEGERVLAVTAHEMRGPLSAVMGALVTLKARGEALGGKDRAVLMDIASRQNKHLARLVDDLLLTMGLEAAAPSLQPEWTNLEDVIEGALEAARSKRQDHRLEVFVEPLRCRIDPTRTLQILRNLVENAYKYTPERSTVAVRARPQEGGLALEVVDEGEGIPADQHHRLFHPFGRIDDGRVRTDGIGIGLYVVDRLVEAMGGRIDLISSPNGSTFTVSIPCETMSADERPLSLVGKSAPEDGLSTYRSTC
jgi:two-component system sensor histidine kinase KdpD